MTQVKKNLPTNLNFSISIIFARKICCLKQSGETWRVIIQSVKPDVTNPAYKVIRFEQAVRNREKRNTLSPEIEHKLVSVTWLQFFRGEHLFTCSSRVSRIKNPATIWNESEQEKKNKLSLRLFVNGWKMFEYLSEYRDLMPTLFVLRNVKVSETFQFSTFFYHFGWLQLNKSQHLICWFSTPINFQINII